MAACSGSVFTPRIICPPDQRTFNSDGTRISEVGLREWVEGGKREGVDGVGVGGKSVVGSMNNPTHGFGETGRRDGGRGGEADEKEDEDEDEMGKLKVDGSEVPERRGSLVKRLWAKLGKA